MNKTIHDLGHKIAIVGVSASGKTVFGRKLAAKLQIPFTPTDSIMWKPGWAYIGEDTVMKRLEEESAKDAWIIEGYIPKNSRAFVFERADSIIYLDYPPVVATKRYLQRWWMHRKEPRPELPGSPEKLDFNFLKKIWLKVEAKSLNEALAETDQDKIIELKTPEETETFLQNKPTLPEIEVSAPAQPTTPPAETPKP